MWVTAANGFGERFFVQKTCDELLNHFNRIAEEKYGLDKDQFKELLNQFDHSWQNSITKILG